MTTLLPNVTIDPREPSYLFVLQEQNIQIDYKYHFLNGK
jgi:hypothetical protein